MKLETLEQINKLLKEQKTKPNEIAVDYDWIKFVWEVKK